MIDLSGRKAMVTGASGAIGGAIARSLHSKGAVVTLSGTRQESLDKLRVATNCGYVLKMGPLAYADREKFTTGPWCKKGDWVIFARYAGSRLPIEGGEVRLLNDDEVLGTIKDPESVLHHI